MTVQAFWGTPTTTPGCFFFSGPMEIGRDDQLGASATWTEQNGRVSLMFGPEIVFRGRRVGQQVILSRQSLHEYDSQWKVSEKLEGTVAGRVLEARYTYRECDKAHPKDCPGRCRVRAGVSLEPVPASPSP